MAIKKSFNGKNIYKPGPYSKFRVDNSSGADTGSSDTLFILGESSKGAPGSVEGIQEFDVSRLETMIAKYGSGPLIDAAIAARSPSNSPGVSGLGKLLVWKTNASTQASAVLLQSATSMYSVKDRFYGVDGNLWSVVVAAGSSGSQKNVSVLQMGGTTEILGENANQSILSVQYIGNGTTAVLAIAGGSRAALTLTTTLAGDQTDGSVNLSIPLAGKTMKQVADQINSSTGYTASVVTAANSARSATELDPKASTSILVALVLKRLQLEILDLINTSARVIATETGILGGVPDNQTKGLTGGAKGASVNSDFSTGMANSLAQDYNVMLPCISRDASVDIADTVLGFTDASSTYTISSVIAAMSAHLAVREDTKNRKEAQGMAGFRNASKATCFSTIASFNDYKIQIAMQDSVFSDATGNLKVGQPHVFAAQMAGIRLGTAVGEPLTHKFLKSLQVGHFINPTTLLEAGDFNTALDADAAIIAGVTFAEKVGNSFRIVADNTTYGIDSSFVYNRGSVIEASYFVFKALRQLADDVFVGGKVSNGIDKSIKNALRNKLRELNQPDVQIITSSDDAPEGFVEETFTVVVQGNTVKVQVEFKPVQGLDFVFFDFVLGDIVQSA